MSTIEVLTSDEKKISIKLKGVTLQYANALRRICLNGVPIYAIDTVDMIENSSVLADEGITHRLGLIPLKTDLSRTDESDSKIILTLDSGDDTETGRTVTSAELSSNDNLVKPSSDQIPIVHLAPGQKLKFEAYARLSKGTEHAKWNSSNIAVLLDAKNEDEHILTVETTGALKPGEIILGGISELAKTLEEFKEILANFKE